MYSKTIWNHSFWWRISYDLVLLLVSLLVGDRACDYKRSKIPRYYFGWRLYFSFCPSFMYKPSTGHGWQWSTSMCKSSSLPFIADCNRNIAMTFIESWLQPQMGLILRLGMRDSPAHAMTCSVYHFMNRMKMHYIDPMHGYHVKVLIDNYRIVS